MSRYDEEAKYDRPKRRTRPRTKDRPSYDDAVIGFVFTRDRGRYACWVDDPDGGREVTAMKARQLGRTGVIVGDRVKLDGNATGDEGSLARIVEVLPGRRCCAAPPMTTTRSSAPWSRTRTNSSSSSRWRTRSRGPG